MPPILPLKVNVVAFVPGQTVAAPAIAAVLHEFPLFTIPVVAVPNFNEFLFMALEPVPPHEFNT